MEIYAIFRYTDLKMTKTELMMVSSVDKLEENLKIIQDDWYFTDDEMEKQIYTEKFVIDRYYSW